MKSYLLALSLVLAALALPLSAEATHACNRQPNFGSISVWAPVFGDNCVGAWASADFGIRCIRGFGADVGLVSVAILDDWGCQTGVLVALP